MGVSKTLHAFSVNIEIDLDFGMVEKVTSSQCGGSSSSRFQCRDEIDLVGMWVIEIDLLHVCWPKIHCFWDEHEN